MNINSIATENSNVPLLSFERVQGLFNNQILMHNQWDLPDKDVVSRRLVIDHVELSYMPIRKADDADTFLYVPVWDFCGQLIARNNGY